MHKNKSSDEGKSPTMQTALFMHGILGSKRNWRTPAKLLTQHASNIKVVAVDHRGHGESHGMPDENTLQSCASDISSLLSRELSSGQKLDLLCGHSFGGKVALKYLQQLYDHPSRPTLPKTTWVLDCLPGCFDGFSNISSGAERDKLNHEQNNVTNPSSNDKEISVGGIFDILSNIPRHFERPEHAQKMLTDKGISLPIAQWLTSECRSTNVNGKHTYELGFNLQVTTELFADFCKTDMWGFLERFDGTSRGPDGAHASIHFVRAGKNPLWTKGQVLERFAQLQHANKNGVMVHTMVSDIMFFIFLGNNYRKHFSVDIANPNSNPNLLLLFLS